MNYFKLLSCVLILIPILFSSSIAVKCGGGGYIGGLNRLAFWIITTYVPPEMKVNEDYSVSYQFTAIYKMHISSLTISIYGAGIEWHKTLLTDVDLDEGTKFTDTVIIHPIGAGEVFFSVEAIYTCFGIRYEGQNWVVIGYSVYETYDELQRALNDLNSSYLDLHMRYQSLSFLYNFTESKRLEIQNDYNTLFAQYTNIQTQMASTTNLATLLAVTTIIFLVTTIYFATRKPRKEGLPPPPSDPLGR